MANKVILFDKSARRDIIDLFDKSVDSENYIIEKENGQRVLSLDGEEIKIRKFAAITKGSESFVRSDLVSLMHLADKLK